MEENIRVKLSELVLDYRVYPRAKIDAMNVSKLRAALEAGESLPPILVDKNSLRVVDGFHRISAMEALWGADYETVISVKPYESDVELFKDAVRLNAAHGRSLTPYDHARVLLVGERAGIALAELAACLSITVERASNLAARKITVIEVTGERTPLKQTVRHLAGRTLTARQAAAIPRLGGMNQAFYVNQLIDLIESDLLDTGDAGLLERLAHLRLLLESLDVVEAHAA